MYAHVTGYPYRGMKTASGKKKIKMKYYTRARCNERIFARHEAAAMRRGPVARACLAKTNFYALKINYITNKCYRYYSFPDANKIKK